MDPNNLGSWSAAVQRVEALSEEMVSTVPRRLVNQKKAKKKLFKSIVTN